MDKRLLGPFFLVAALLTGFMASCSDESEEEDEYENWQERNEIFLDSIISVSENPPSGEIWRTHLNYKLQSSDYDLDITKFDYVYVKVLKEGNEDGITPYSTDSVYTAYKGYFINGETFDYSYSWDFDLEFTEANYVTLVSAVVTGWTTALLYMKEGERVMVYIPYKLGYGEDDYSSIPGYSLLIFDLYLGKVVHPDGPEVWSLGLLTDEED